MGVPSRHSNSGPQRPRIPRVAVPRVWPHWDEDADRDAIDTVISEMHGLWWLLAESGDTFDDPTFHGPNAEFWIDPPAPRIRHRASNWDALDELDAQRQDEVENLGPLESFQLDVPGYQTGDPTIAIANYQFARDRWAELLGKQCWKRVRNTYPSPGVLAVLVQQTFGTASTDAIQCLMFEAGDPHAISEKAIGYMETDRRQFVSLVAPTYILFLSSLIEQGLWSSIQQEQPQKQSSDEPTLADIENGRRILDKMATRNPSVQKFREACREDGIKLRNVKAGKILRIIQNRPSPSSPGDEPI